MIPTAELVSEPAPLIAPTLLKLPVPRSTRLLVPLVMVLVAVPTVSVLLLSQIGDAASTLVGSRAEILGGAILILIGAVILYEHLHGAA